MNIHEFAVFVTLGNKSIRESMWSEIQLSEAARFTNIFYSDIKFELDTKENKQKIIDKFGELYLKYKKNPEIIGDILDNPPPEKIIDK